MSKAIGIKAFGKSGKFKLEIGSSIGAGTQGSVLFIDSSTSLAEDNSNLFWDDTNNRLGIGTSVPISKVDIRDNLSTIQCGELSASSIFGAISMNSSGITTSNYALTSDVNNTYINGSTSEVGLRLNNISQITSRSNGITHIGDIITPSFFTGKNMFIGNSSANSAVYVGQDATHNLGYIWRYNANPGFALAQLFTFGFANDIDIAGKIITISPAGTQALKLTATGFCHFGDEITPSFSSGKVLFLGNNSANSAVYVGQDATHNLGYLWRYNATPANASALMFTFGFSNNIEIACKDIILSPTGTELMRLKGTSIGIGTATPNISAILDLTSTTKAFMPPRVTTAQKNAIASPAAGMVVFDTTLAKLSVYTTIWEAITSV